MAMIKVKEKFEVTLPDAIIKQADLSVGDYLEILMENEKIVLQPQPIAAVPEVEAALEAGLKDYEEGRVIGPFKNMAEFRQYKAAQKKS